MKILKNVDFPFRTLHVIPVEQKFINYSLQNQFLKFLKKSTFEPFSFRIDKNRNSLGDSNVHWEVDNRAFFAFQVSKEAC